MNDVPLRPNESLPKSGAWRTRLRWQVIRHILTVRPTREAAHFKACIVKPDRLGDFVLATGAIRLLRKHFGPENCVLVVSPYAEKLAAREFPDSPRVTAPAFVPKKLRKLLPLWRTLGLRFRHYTFDHAISLRPYPSLYLNALLSWIPAQQRHGFSDSPLPAEVDSRNLNFAQHLAFPSTPSTGLCLDLQAHADLLSTILNRPIQPDEIKPRLSSFDQSDEGYLLIAPYSSDRLKDYPAKLLCEALQEFQKNNPCPLRVLVSTEQAGLLPELRTEADARGVRISSIEVGTSQNHYLEAIAHARGVLTMDSASAHIAGAFEKPCVVLMGGGHRNIFGPWWHSDRQRWLRNQLPCYGCNWQCPYPEAHCLTGISPRDVTAALVDVLS